jgi:hypothetical protein
VGHNLLDMNPRKKKPWRQDSTHSELRHEIGEMLGGAQRKSGFYREDRRLLSPIVHPAALSIYQTELRRSQVNAFNIHVSLGVKPRHCVSRSRRFGRTYCLPLRGQVDQERSKIRRNDGKHLKTQRCIPDERNSQSNRCEHLKINLNAFVYEKGSNSLNCHEKKSS